MNVTITSPRVRHSLMSSGPLHLHVDANLAVVLALCIATLIALKPSVAEGAEVWGATNGDIIQRYPIGGPTTQFAANLPPGVLLVDLEVVGSEVWGATDGNIIQRYPIAGGPTTQFAANLPPGALLVDLEVIPEPTSFLLLTIGLFSVSLCRSRCH